MKKVNFFLALCLIAFNLVSLSSCSKDDDNDGVSKPTVDLAEVGLENEKTVMAGSKGGLHVEAEILAEGLIKSINIEIHKADGSNKMEFNYTEGKYIGVKNTEFHEHLVIPETAEEGDYHFHFTVTDMKGNQTTEETTIHVTEYDANAPVVTMKNVGVNGDKTGYLGGKINVAAAISALNGIDEIEIEFHNTDTNKEYPMDIDGYEGQTSVDFNQDIVIPAEATAGTYHIHFTVTDKKGESYTAENEGVIIKAKQ